MSFFHSRGTYASPYFREATFRDILWACFTINTASIPTGALDFCPLSRIFSAGRSMILLIRTYVRELPPVIAIGCGNIVIL
jgi:hypothetical protein